VRKRREEASAKEWRETRIERKERQNERRKGRNKEREEKEYSGRRAGQQR
jgi:hypothetical protein